MLVYQSGSLQETESTLNGSDDESLIHGQLVEGWVGLSEHTRGGEASRV